MGKSDAFALAMFVASWSAQGPAGEAWRNEPLWNKDPVAGSPTAEASRACELTGDWKPKEGRGSLRFAREGEAIVGRVVEPPRDDVAVGFAMLYELRWVEKGQRYEGWLARSEDSILRAEVTCRSSDEIVVRGKLGLLGRSFEWIRMR